MTLSHQTVRFKRTWAASMTISPTLPASPFLLRWDDKYLYLHILYISVTFLAKKFLWNQDYFLKTCVHGPTFNIGHLLRDNLLRLRCGKWWRNTQYWAIWLRYVHCTHQKNQHPIKPSIKISTFPQYCMFDYIDILTPRIRYSYCYYSCSVTEKTG